MAKCPPEPSEGLGQKEGFHSLKMKLKTHEAAKFEIDTNKFEIVLKAGFDVKALSKLEHYDSAFNVSVVESAVFIQVEEQELRYSIAVKETGWYKLNIFAAKKDDDNKSVPGVFTYLFHVTQVRYAVAPYPHQFADWRDGCHLYEPLSVDGSLDLDKVKFKVKIPGARKVAVKAGEVWTHLENDGGDKWKGDVRLREQFDSPDNVKISLNANMGGPDANSYATLLQYSTKPE
eukprot:TRINITY_DN130736_c0_g1_i1.p1 TRINITY_DN130736_c0_g1~~TRINITY_DN130736_c0_g1_i1.p1  ORF type:complete len:232 (-),score=71.52 TRINITY_DN130736_c0_g1_i1:194-889(-)